MIGPMQIAYLVLVVLGVWEHATAHQSSTSIDQVGARVQGGTIFWVGLILFIVSAFVKIFG